MKINSKIMMVAILFAQAPAFAKTTADILAEKRKQRLAADLSRIQGDIRCVTPNTEVILSKDMSQVFVKKNNVVINAKIQFLRDKPDWFGHHKIGFSILGLDQSKKGGVVSDHELNIDQLNGTVDPKELFDGKTQSEAMTQLKILRGGYVSEDGSVVLGQGGQLSAENNPNVRYTCEYLN